MLTACYSPPMLWPKFTSIPFYREGKAGKHHSKSLPGRSFPFIKCRVNCHIIASTTVLKHSEPICNRILASPYSSCQPIVHSPLSVSCGNGASVWFHTWSDSDFPDNGLLRQHPDLAKAHSVLFYIYYIINASGLSGWILFCDVPTHHWSTLGKGSCFLLCA